MLCLSDYMVWDIWVWDVNGRLIYIYICKIISLLAAEKIYFLKVNTIVRDFNSLYTHYWRDYTNLKRIRNYTRTLEIPQPSNR